MLSSVKRIGRAVRAVATRDPDQRISRIYELPDPEHQFADRATRYINIGYWADESTTVDQAGEAVAAMLADAARFEAGQDILDLGCGYGDQDFLWLKEKDPRRIHAIDVTPRQIEDAQRRAEREGVTDRLHFHVGTATKLPFDDASFDRVVALDAALHFHTRADFFREAFRVLRPGGVLGTVDTIPLDPSTPRKSFRTPRFSLYRFAVPDENWYDRSTYAERLTEAGFVDGTVTSIREHTWEPWYRYWTGIAKDPSAHPDLPPEALETVTKEWRDTEQIKAELDSLDYVVAIATKPA
jgi:cyclopropane fatty-acyl-phospholipid synthase-like methyltransferase